MAIFLLLMLFPDVMYRTQNYSANRWLYAATPVTEDHAEDALPDHDAANEGETVDH